jgi:hypothetical protein
MAVLVGGFSVLSARASANEETKDGLIASAFPEIRELQARLGIVQEAVARIDETTTEIKEDTAFLKLAADQWLSAEIYSWKANEYIEPNGPNHIRFSVQNDSAFTYQDVRVRIQPDRSASEWALEGFMLVPGTYENSEKTYRGEYPDRIQACISAVRKEDGAVIREIRTFGNREDVSSNGGVSEGSMRYRTVDSTGLELVSDNETCEA